MQGLAQGLAQGLPEPWFNLGVAGLTPPQIDVARQVEENDRRLALMHAERALQDRNRHGRIAEVGIEHSFERDATVASVRIGAFCVSHTLPREAAHEPVEFRPRQLQHAARELTRRMAEALENDIYRQLMEHDQRQRAERLGYYGRGPAMAWRDEINHGIDLTAGAVNFARALMGGEEVAKNDDPITHIKDLPKVIEFEGYKAELIDTTNKVFAEGTNMIHCMGWAYARRMSEGRYAAYHISADKPKLPASGLTLGFHKNETGFIFDQLKGKKNDTHYCYSAEILAFVHHVDNAINKRNEGDKPWQTQETQAATGQREQGFGERIRAVFGATRVQEGRQSVSVQNLDP